MNKLIRNADKQLWEEVKAQSVLNGVNLRQWVEDVLREAVKRANNAPAMAAYNKSSQLRKRLRNEAKCDYCHRIVFKDSTGADRLLLHHIKPLVEGGSGSIDNLTILCVSCHRKVHAGKIIVDPYARSLNKALIEADSNTQHCEICNAPIPKGKRPAWFNNERHIVCSLQCEFILNGGNLGEWRRSSKTRAAINRIRRWENGIGS